MGLLSRIFGRSEARALAGAAIPHVPDVVGLFSTGGYNDASVAVNELTAMSAAAVYACVAVISQAVAALPVCVRDRQSADKQLDHPAARLLADEPNEYQSAPTWRENQMVQLLLWGNCYSFV